MRLSKAFQRAEEAARETDEYWADSVKIDFSVALEKRRRLAGIGYSTLAERIKTSAAYISKVFRGESNLTIESMVKLARAVDGHLNIEIVDKSLASYKWDVTEISERKNKQPIRFQSGITYTANDASFPQAA